MWYLIITLYGFVMLISAHHNTYFVFEDSRLNIHYRKQKREFMSLWEQIEPCRHTLITNYFSIFLLIFKEKQRDLDKKHTLFLRWRVLPLGLRWFVTFLFN